MIKAFGSFRLDTVNRCLWDGEAEVELPPTPFELLKYLIDNAGRLVSQAEALENIWPGVFVRPDVLKTHIHMIRQALRDSADKPTYIETRSRRGYRFIAPVTEGDRTVPDSNAPIYRSGIVGREKEFAALIAALDKAEAGGRSVIFVTGEAGIGKTALVDEFSHQIATRTDTVFLSGQCNPPICTVEPFFPLLDVLAQLYRSGNPDEIAATLAQFAPNWLNRIPEIGDPRGSASSLSQDRMAREFCSALEILARTRTVVIVIEDCQWIDPSTLDAISMIGRRRDFARLLIVLTERPDVSSRPQSVMSQLRLDLQTRRLAVELSLQRLEQQDILLLLQGDEAHSVPAELLGLVTSYSEGNPLFVRATLEHLLDKGLTRREQGAFVVTAALTKQSVGIPHIIEQMLDLELARLDQEAQSVLSAGAIAGKSFCAFSLSVLLDVDSVSAEGQCYQIIDSSRLIRTNGFALLGDGSATPRFAFDFGIYRDVLHQRQPPIWRAAQHRRLGERAEHSLGQKIAYYARELAYRFEQCDDWPRVINYLELAIQSAQRRQAVDEAKKLKIRVLQVRQQSKNLFDHRARIGFEARPVEH